MSDEHFHMEFAPGWLLEDANALSCGACPHHRLVQVNMGPATFRLTFEAFQAFSALVQRMSHQISQVDAEIPLQANSALMQRQDETERGSAEYGGAPERSGKVISGLFSRKEH